MNPVRIIPFAFFLAAATAASGVTIGQFNVTATEAFNTLASSGTSSALPAGWSLLETGSAFNTSYTAGTGSSTTGDTYSFGAAASSDRALGTLQSGSLVSSIGTLVSNGTGGTITSLTVSYFGEQWRLGTAGRADRLDFSFSTDASGLGSGTWTDVNQLDFLTPNTGAAVGALDGNAAGNRTAISFTITGLNIANGANVWLRWTDFNATGSDDGLAIDDFSISAAGAAAQSAPDQLPFAATFVVFGLLLVARNRPIRRA